MVDVHICPTDPAGRNADQHLVGRKRVFWKLTAFEGLTAQKICTFHDSASLFIHKCLLGLAWKKSLRPWALSH